MSNSDTLKGLTVKDLSMLIIAAAVGIYFVTMAIVYTQAAFNPQSNIAFTGQIDIGKFQEQFAMFLGAAIAMISSALTVKQTLAAQAE